MAIEAFVGSVGGGKSYCSVKRMLAYMARGGRVVTNILLNGYDIDTSSFASDSPVLSYLRKIHKWEYQVGQYTYISFERMCEDSSWYRSIPAGQSRTLRTLLVVDEATDLFDTLDRDKARTDSMYRELFRFLRLSRHAHVDVLFICQDLASINSRLRGLVSGGWRSTDMGRYRLPFLRIKFPFDLFLLQKFNRKMDLEVSREWLAKDDDIFACYNSEAFGGDLNVSWDGVIINDGKIVKKGKMSKFEKLLLIVCLLLSAVTSITVLTSNKEISNPMPLDYSVPSITTNIVVSTIDTNSITSLLNDYTGFQVKRGIMSFCIQPNGDSKVIFDNKPFFLGLESEYGVVTDIVKGKLAKCVKGHKVTYLMPRLTRIKEQQKGVSTNVTLRPLPVPF